MATTTTNPFPRIGSQGTDQGVSEPPSSLTMDQNSSEREPDIFEKQDESHTTQEERENNGSANNISLDQDIQESAEDLPIELVSLTDRFIESLSARVYNTPPSIDKLSILFQEFYARASSHVETHTSILASRLRRNNSPSPGRPPAVSRHSSKGGEKTGPAKLFAEQQMLTATEVAERRRARAFFQQKRQALEEAIERRVCEAVYDKIWRHRSTLDEVRDEKLRSKTAALAVVGFGLKDLGVDIEAKEELIKSDVWLAGARESLMRMNESKFPLGKLQHLTAAHKAIVDSLTNILPSSSSADEILPTLIYALVTSPPEGINIISNLLFVQRFRAASKIDGETAYCLTNLEAAISFLENIDLSDIDGVRDAPLELKGGRKSPELQGSVESSSQSNISSTPITSLATPLITSNSKKPDFLSPKSNISPKLIQTESPQNRLSSIFQPPAKALGAANDLVRNTADQGIKNISSTLDNSFNFLFGRLKEIQVVQGGETKDGVNIVPKTLDDARRLVNTPPGMSDEFSEANKLPDQENNRSNVPVATRSRLDDRLASLVAGRKQAGDRPIRRESNLDSSSNMSPVQTSTSGPQSQNPAFGSMRNFGNTINPLNHIPGMIRGLSRSSPEPSQAPSISGEHSRAADIAPGKEKYSITNVSPPIQRFIELDDASKLTIADIPKLLEDYKRLASVVNSLKNS